MSGYMAVAMAWYGYEMLQYVMYWLFWFGYGVSFNLNDLSVAEGDGLVIEIYLKLKQNISTSNNSLIG